MKHKRSVSHTMKIFIMKKYKNNERNTPKKEEKSWMASGKNFNSTTLGLSYIYTHIKTYILENFHRYCRRLHTNKEEKNWEK